MGLILDMTIACLFRVKVFMLPTPLADEYTRGVWPIDPVVRPSCGLPAMPHVGIDVLLISVVFLVIHSSPMIQLSKILLSHTQ
ncbi:hypothetical protein ACFLVR_05485 [Chloroflexota bacterium]